MDTYLVKFKRTLAVRHAVEETLEIEVEAHDAEAARLQVAALIDGGDTEGQWEEGRDRIVGSDVVSTEFLEAVRSEHGLPDGTDRERLDDPECGHCHHNHPPGVDCDDHASLLEAEDRDRDASFLGWLKLAADTPDRLRSCDVDRVMSAVPAGLRGRFKAWALPQISMSAVRKAVETWTDD